MTTAAETIPAAQVGWSGSLLALGATVGASVQQPWTGRDDPTIMLTFYGSDFTPHNIYLDPATAQALTAAVTRALIEVHA